MEIRGLCEFGEVGFLHVARLAELLVEGEGCLEGMRRVSALAQFQVVAKQVAVCRVCAVLDDEFGALHWVFAAEVGDALVGDEHLYRVFAVVEVGNHRHDVADFALLGD